MSYYGRYLYLGLDIFNDVDIEGIARLVGPDGIYQVGMTERQVVAFVEDVLHFLKIIWMKAVIEKRRRDLIRMQDDLARMEQQVEEMTFRKPAGGDGGASKA